MLAAAANTDQAYLVNADSEIAKKKKGNGRTCGKGLGLGTNGG